MKTIQSFFKKQNDEFLPDNGGLLKVTVGVFSSILVVCVMHLTHIVF